MSLMKKTAIILTFLGMVTYATATVAAPQGFYNLVAHHATLKPTDQAGVYLLTVGDVETVDWVRSTHSETEKNSCPMTTEDFVNALNKEGANPWVIMQPITVSPIIGYSFATFSNTHYDPIKKRVTSTVTVDQKAPKMKNFGLTQFLVKLDVEPPCLMN